MQAVGLLPGDKFVEVAEDEYLKMSAKERGKLPRRAVTRPRTLCSAHRERMHIGTTAGSWCIPTTSPVTLVD